MLAQNDPYHTFLRKNWQVQEHIFEDDTAFQRKGFETPTGKGARKLNFQHSEAKSDRVMSYFSFN